MPTTVNILILDDNDSDRLVLKRTLEQAGLSCDFTEPQSLEEALAECGVGHFDCAFVEYRLSEGDGLKALAALQQQCPFMPVIMSTAYGDETLAAEAIKQGAADYIPKAKVQPKPIRRCVENALQKSAMRRKITQQREQLENFSRVLVHDLKAPIQTVQSFAGLIQQSIEEGSFESIRDYCRRAIRASQRATALLDTLHLYTKASDEVVFEAVDMRQVMHDTLINLDAAIQERNAQVTYDDLPTVPGSAPQLTQLLQNLISNGIKYCKSETPKVHVAAEAMDGKGWLFKVKDNGIGIAEANCQQIFEPFKRLHSADEYEGSGLGLATCKKVIERHQGTIWSESKEGTGTTLFFTLPRTHAE